MNLEKNDELCISHEVFNKQNENVFTDKNTEIYELKEKYKYDDLSSDNKLNKNKNKNKKKTKKLSIKEN